MKIIAGNSVTVNNNVVVSVANQPAEVYVLDATKANYSNFNGGNNSTNGMFIIDGTQDRPSPGPIPISASRRRPWAAGQTVVCRRRGAELQHYSLAFAQRSGYERDWNTPLPTSLFVEEITGAECNPGEDQSSCRREWNGIERRGRQRDDAVFVRAGGPADITAVARRAKLFGETFQPRRQLGIAARNPVAAPDHVRPQRSPVLSRTIASRPSRY